MERRSKRKTEGVTLEDAKRDCIAKKLAYTNACDIVEFHKELLLDSNYNCNKLAHESLVVVKNHCNRRKADYTIAQEKYDLIVADVERLRKELSDLVGNSSSDSTTGVGSSLPVSEIANGITSPTASVDYFGSDPSPNQSDQAPSTSVSAVSSGDIRYYGPYMGFSIKHIWKTCVPNLAYFVPIGTTDRRLRSKIPLLEAPEPRERVNAPLRGPSPTLDLIGSYGDYVPTTYGSTIVHVLRTCLPLHVGNSYASPVGTLDHELDLFRNSFGELPPME